MAKRISFIVGLLLESKDSHFIRKWPSPSFSKALSDYIFAGTVRILADNGNNNKAKSADQFPDQHPNNEPLNNNLTIFTKNKKSKPY